MDDVKLATFSVATLTRAEAEARDAEGLRAYDAYVRELTLAQKDRDRRPLRKAWNR